jgi:AraC-like DNA-binding protein
VLVCDAAKQLMPFQFNFYSALLLLPFVHGLLFAVLLFVRSIIRQRSNDAFMATLLLVLSITVAFWMLGFAGWYDTHDAYTSFMFYFPFNLLLFVGPCLWFYFQSSVNAGFKFSRSHWPHAILPGLLLLLCILKLVVDFLSEYPFPPTEEFQYGTRGSWAQLDKSLPVKLLSYASVFYYLFITLRSFKRYRIYLVNHFSETESLNLNWLQRMLVAAGIGLFVFFLFFTAGLMNGSVSYKLSWFAYIGIGILIYYLSIQSYLFSPHLLRQLNFVPAAEEATPKTETDDLEQRITLLQEIISQQRPYLDPELTLAQLARLNNTNTATLSKAINSKLGQNFNDYINGLRIAEFQNSLRRGEHKKHTLMALAFDAGFNSKATFNRAFRKATGKNPSEWLKENEIEDNL